MPLSSIDVFTEYSKLKGKILAVTFNKTTYTILQFSCALHFIRRLTDRKMHQ